MAMPKLLGASQVARDAADDQKVALTGTSISGHSALAFVGSSPVPIIYLPLGEPT
jgi:hypothetical protein